MQSLRLLSGKDIGPTFIEFNVCGNTDTKKNQLLFLKNEKTVFLRKSMMFSEKGFPQGIQEETCIVIEVYKSRAVKNQSILLNNQQITKETKKEIKTCIETTENENTTNQNLWDSVKAVLRGRFIAINPTSRNRREIKYIT